MEINGMKLPLAMIVAGFLGGAVWVGDIQSRVSAQETAVKEHRDKPAHETTISDVATIKALVSHNTKSIDEVKQELKELKKQAAKDKQEILDAIRNRE